MMAERIIGNMFIVEKNLFKLLRISSSLVLQIDHARIRTVHAKKDDSLGTKQFIFPSAHPNSSLDINKVKKLTKLKPIHN